MINTEIGVLGPTNVMVPDTAVHNDKVTFYTDGTARNFDRKLIYRFAAVGLLKADVPGPKWPLEKLRSPVALETCAIRVGDRDIVIAPESMSVLSGYWWIEEDLHLTPSAHHGAPVVSARDGSVIGILLVTERATKIQPLPRGLVQE